MASSWSRWRGRSSGVPWDFTQQLLPPDQELFRPILDGAIRRVPVLAQAEARPPRQRAGGHHPGQPPAPRPRARRAAASGSPAGLSHTGFGAGGAIGDIVADWLVDGEPPYDVTEMNVRRFGPVYADGAYAAERARESYKYYYTLRFPHDENEWARGRRRSALDAAAGQGRARCSARRTAGSGPTLLRAGHGGPARRRRPAALGLGQAGVLRPRRRRARGGARGRGTLRHDVVRQDRRDRARRGALPPAAGRQRRGPPAPGRVVYTQLLNPRGGIESDLTVARLAPEHFRVVTGSAFVAERPRLDARCTCPMTARWTLREVTEAWACIGLWGPEARRILGRVSPSDLVERRVPVHDRARAIALGRRAGRGPSG